MTILNSTAELGKSTLIFAVALSWWGGAWLQEGL